MQESTDQQQDAEEIPISSQEMNPTEHIEGIDVPPTEKRDHVEDNHLCESENFVFNDPSKVGGVESPGDPNKLIEHVEEDIPETMEVDGEAKDVQESEAGEVPIVDEQMNEELREREEIEEQLQESKQDAENVKDGNEDGT